MRKFGFKLYISNPKQTIQPLYAGQRNQKEN